MRMATKRRHDEDEGYLSQSTIDRPPREVEEEADAQISIFEEPDALKLVEDGEPHERMFTVQLHVVLTPDDGKPTRIPLVCGMCKGTLVQEVLEKAVISRRNKRIIAATLDNPKDRETEN